MRAPVTCKPVQPAAAHRAVLRAGAISTRRYSFQNGFIRRCCESFGLPRRCLFQWTRALLRPLVPPSMVRGGWVYGQKTVCSLGPPRRCGHNPRQFYQALLRATGHTLADSVPHHPAPPRRAPLCYRTATTRRGAEQGRAEQSRAGQSRAERRGVAGSGRAGRGGAVRRADGRVIHGPADKPQAGPPRRLRLRVGGAARLLGCWV